MTPNLDATEPWPIGSIVLLILAGCLYALMLVPLLDAARGLPPMSGEGRYSAAWSELFALLFGGVLWIILGILLWGGAQSGQMPHWMTLAIGPFYLLAGLAGGYAIDRLHQFPQGWLVLVPVLLPPLIALQALWGRLPALHKALPPDIAGAILVGAVALVALATVPLAASDAALGPERWARSRTPEQAATEQAIQDQQRQEKEAEFQKLGEDSLLEDYLEFINYLPLGEEGAERALVGARRVKHRQSDAVMLLNGFKIDRLEALWRLDLAATPELCAAYGDALQRYAAREIRLDDTVAALERQLPNVKWLIGQHCDLGPTLAAIDATLRQAAKSSGYGRSAQLKPFLATLAELRQGH